MPGVGRKIKSSAAPLDQGLRKEETGNSSFKSLFLSFLGATRPALQLCNNKANVADWI